MKLAAPGAILLAAAAMAQDRPARVRGMPPEIIIEPPVRDVVKIDPRHYRLEFENSRVRVLRARLPPGAKVPLHDDGPATLVCVSECHIRFTRPDKKIQDVHMEAGQTRWIWDDTRWEENLSTEPAELLWIELKPDRKGS